MFHQSQWLILLFLGLVSVSSAAVRVEPSLQNWQLWHHTDGEFSAQLSQAPLVYVRCSLRDAGFHRILVTEVHAETHEALSLCHNTPVILVENITQDMYIDLDQISALTEFGGPQIIASAHMDTEKAAAVSNGYVVLVYSHLHDNWTQVELPVHFRYQAPGDSWYKMVNVPAPLVFQQCQEAKLEKDLQSCLPECKGKITARFPCSVSSGEWCLWECIDISVETANAHLVRAVVPRGLEGHVTVVVMATVLVALAGTLYLVYVMVQ